MRILPTGDPATWSLSNISELIRNVSDLALLLAGGIAVIYIIIGAYGYLTAFGNEEKVNKAKITITWAIVGVVVIILAKVIVTEVFNILTPNPPSL